MFPRVSVEDQIDRSRSHPKFPGQPVTEFSLPTTLEDLTNLLFGQFRHVDLFASRTSSPFDAISSVVQACSEDEMAWIDARGIITRVSELKASRDGTVDNFPGYPVSSSKDELAVSICKQSALKRPACIRSSRRIRVGKYVSRYTFEAGFGAESGRGLGDMSINPTGFSAAFTLKDVDDHRGSPLKERSGWGMGPRPEMRSVVGIASPDQAPRSVYHGE